MPIVQIHTNLSADALPPEFRVKLVEMFASIFKLSQHSVLVGLSTDERLYGGVDGSDPLFVMQVIKADGFEDVDENRQTIKALLGLLIGEMGVPEKSIRIILLNVPSTRIGISAGLLTDVIKERQKASGTKQPSQD
ncbi:uncharacterized protein LOC110990108 [Acanthaster planci]|uniref:Uncharacterized protein LOC110990108 n=1 Tax=Acanthaster planci TaxID=133434 RepID=A0A8B7ZZV1_ACAPL|nr:uncharacterized protein LOC110990108 [Acanthaster planci]XP_022110637.1 uncharacterized protein LOC110990108 [Acanthaster planci]